MARVPRTLVSFCRRAWIAAVQGEDGEGLSGWLFLTVPAWFGLFLLARTGFPLGWPLFAAATAGILLLLLLATLAWLQRGRGP
jgi:hypothetical protein